MTTLPDLPMPREDEFPFDPPPEYAALRTGDPVVKVSCPTGIEAWLVSTYEGVRDVLGDGRRFTSRPGQVAHILTSFDPESPVNGEFSRLDGPEHVRIRRNFAPQLSHARRLAELRPLVEDIVGQAVDRLDGTAQPLMLHKPFSRWITTAVIAELIGVPPDQRFLLHDAAKALFDPATTAEELDTALQPLWAYLYGLVTTRRAAPGDDVMSRMIRHSADSDRPLTDLELVRMNGALLVAGFDTTASMLTHGLLALLCHPREWARLCADPGLAPSAAEELVRYLGVGVGLMRQATEDTRVCGRDIAAGDYVVAAVQSANRDPALHRDGDVLDVTRKPGAHVGFGHGAHACVGQQIARMELTSALRALATRVPTLRLACPADEVEFKKDSVVRGPVDMPVAWKEVAPR
ncbi:cytochrome P450 [Mangrovihabitans endophyticus]|uniref:Cytochrome P450 n=1 Tax=Mangrovihabitans endophyticus TaxID=1751298 RepID=A0A8J3C443_9ACTN|nr:cytochrome P450 [Mangrovihabitans endophyticus]GGL04150.1 cytochrome P450 [Mangrovihabitans endophyticus]